MMNMMEYRGYHAKLEYDSEDRCFYGEVFGINDSLNFDGETVDELEAMFHQSVDNYLEFCEELGKEPEKEFKGTFNVRINPELHKEAAYKALQSNLSLNQFVSNAIAHEIEGIFCKPETTYIVIGREEQLSWSMNWSFDPMQHQSAYSGNDGFKTRLGALNYAAN